MITIDQLEIPLESIQLTTEEQEQAPAGLLQKFLMEEPQSILSRVLNREGKKLSKNAKVTAVYFLPPKLVIFNPTKG